MDLYKKIERKDLLMEYFYMIIRENELRKVKKLEEFMVKFNVVIDEILFEDKNIVFEFGGDEFSIK